jgi:hypothetical protein
MIIADDEQDVARLVFCGSAKSRAKPEADGKKGTEHGSYWDITVEVVSWGLRHAKKVIHQKADTSDNSSAAIF